jgi:putative phosphoesterase
MKIGVLSDTHNYLDPKIPALFAGAQQILHAGDIGLPSLLCELELIAPVTAVAGNTDEPAFQFKLVATLDLDGRRFLLQHIVDPLSLTDPLKERLARDRPDVVVFGHSHRPFCQTVDGVLFFNPGYAGKSRFRLPRTVALLHSEPDGLRPEFIEL